MAFWRESKEAVMQSEAEMDYIGYQARALKKVTPIYVAIRFVTKDLLYYFFYSYSFTFFRFVGSPSVVEDLRASELRYYF